MNGQPEKQLDLSDLRFDSEDRVSGDDENSIDPVFEHR